MIYTITFNPSLDYVISVNDFQTGDINRTTNELLFPGGKGINVSMVLSNLGVENTALGFVAGFTGEELQHRLQEKGIHTNFIIAEQGMTRINVKLSSYPTKTNENQQILSEPIETNENQRFLKQETEINGQGPYISESELAQLMDSIAAMTEEDILVVSGSVSKGIPQNIYGDIVKLCNEKQIRVVIDASSALLWNTLEYAPFLIKPNHHELGDIFNRELHSHDEIVFYAKELQSRGARNVLVSVGSKGAVLVAEDGSVYEMQAPQGQVLNSVGAGDSMVAGFLAEYLQSEDYEKALQMGVCAGSATAFSEGLAKREEIYNILNSF